MKKVLKWLPVLILVAGIFCCAFATAESSGSCGYNLTWTLDDNGLLTITGTGEMTSHPWTASETASEVEQVIIKPGVTSIGGWAFGGCSSLTSITIPESVTSIGDRAFINCSSLTSITIPGGVTSIGDYAFYNCSSLTSITIPESVTSIGDYAFYNCSSLTSITIPESVIHIGYSCFQYCEKLTDIHISSIESWLSIEFEDSYSHPNYNYKTTNHHLYIGDTELTSITIPEGITSIPSYTFAYFGSLTNVTLPEGLIHIGICAFSDCKNLMDISIPDTVTRIEYHAFASCGMESFTIPRGITNIENECDIAPYNTKKLYIHDTLTNIGDYCFSGFSKLTDVYYDGTKSQWQSIRIGYGNYELTRATLHYKESYGSCGDNLSWMLDNFGLLTISGEGTMTSHPWDNSKVKEVIIEDGITNIVAYAFRSCRSLTSITIPNSITDIGGYAFDNCNNIESIYLVSCNSYAHQYVKSNHISGHIIMGNHQGNPVIAEEIPPTCSQTGKTEGAYCDVCGDVIYGCETIPQLEHTIVIDPAVPATDTESGLTEGSHCSVCGTTIVQQEYIHPFWDLETVDQGVVITRYYGSEKRLSIPSSINGTKVVGILDNAFTALNCPTNVYIPKSVDSIGDKAFGKAVKIYCHKYSEADFWADDVGYSKVYVDNTTSGEFYYLTLNNIASGFRLECENEWEIDATVWPRTGAEQLIWNSSNPEVVSVLNGIITALSPGEATITLQVGGRTTSVVVQSFALPRSFDLSENNIIVVSGEPYQIIVIDIIPERAEIEITWSTTNSGIVEVDQNGLITPRRIGSAIVYAESQNGIRRECEVTVCYPVSSITIDEDQYTIDIGETLQMIAHVSDGNNSYENVLVQFSSSDDTIATVNRNGMVKGLRTGTITITVFATSGVSASAEINVVCRNHVVVTDYAVAATCETSGLTEGKHCERCGEVFTAQEIIPALGHNYCVIEEIPASSGSNGFYIRECTRCGSKQILTIESNSNSPMVGTWRPHHIIHKTLGELPPTQWGNMADMVFIYKQNGTFEFNSIGSDHELHHGSGKWYIDNGDLYWVGFSEKRTIGLSGYYVVPGDDNCMVFLSPEGQDLRGFSQYLGHWESRYIYRKNSDRRIRCEYWHDFVELGIDINESGMISINGNEGEWKMIGETIIIDGAPDLLLLNSKGQMIIKLNENDYLILTHNNQDSDVIKSLIIPTGTKTIEEEAFFGTFADEVIIPNGCESIGSKAFSNCARLGAVVIPNSVVFIADDAFADSSVTVITENNSYAMNWAAEHGVDCIQRN